MATVPHSLSPSHSRTLLIIFAVGVLSMVLPTIFSLASQAWTREEGIHGPIVLATGGWLIWRRWNEIVARAAPGSSPMVLVLFAVTLAFYVFGRAFDFISFETIALIGAGVILAYSFVGLSVLQSLWFPIFYLLFLVPMPGWFVDQLTAPLKMLVSYCAETLLSSAGYAIARQGVVLYVDQYQLLVKDACAGLNSLFSLTSISLFYIYLRHNASWRYAIFLVLWIVPIAIFANILRVIALVLITHYFGEEAAQGFLHNSAGMFMFIVALLGIFALDNLFELLFFKRGSVR
jgi:eight transmembrane protein EpsH (proposed exosortase)